MAESINIHPDFQKMPAMKSVSSPWLLGLVNTALQFAAALKWWKFRRVATRQILPASDGGQFPVWIIRPEHLGDPCPVLVYLHGSGFMVKHVPQHIENAVRYAHEADCMVLFVDYRLAPKYRFPTPFDDCYTTLDWAVDNAPVLGVDAGRIAIGGDSAGGALAAAVAQKAQRENRHLCGQLLVYPITDCRCETWSSTAFANVQPFKEFSMPAVWETYLGKQPDKHPPDYASPMHGELTGLPPAYVETEEYDPWRDEGIAYAKAMQEAGVDVELNEVKGSVHGFDAFAPKSSLVQAAITRRVAFLKRIFQ